MLRSSTIPANNIGRERCYGCFRPLGDCFCSEIPTIDNRTEVLIVQHMRERFHPFNTARIVRKALRNSRLIAAHTRDLAASLSFEPGAALLYPGSEATLLSELPASERPRQLVILDGTWHHAKTLVRDIPALAQLPRYRLAPAAPSRYQIRREPSAMSLSTVEATIAALEVLEPDTRGFDQLMNAFLAMIDHQLAHPKSEFGGRSNKRRKRNCGNIPSALLSDLNHVVVAYGESASREPGSERVPRLPVYWVAERLGTGERFACAIEPRFPLNEAFLAHLELDREAFRNALSIEEAQIAWQAFQRPGDTLAVYNQGVARLLELISAVPTPCLVLKSVDYNARQRYGTLDELLLAEGIAVGASRHPGRAGKRLANVAAFVRHLNALGNAAMGGHG
jgi:DTW domain-containing protein YfiP